MNTIMSTLSFMYVMMAILSFACLIVTIKMVKSFILAKRNNNPNTSLMFVMILVMAVATVALAYPLVMKLLG